MQLSAYQNHAFLDWRIVVGDEQWQAVDDALNGAGVPSVQGKWDGMFGVKEEVEKEKPKKLMKKRATRKKETAKKRATSNKTKTKKKVD